jgi:uncharacterized protein YcfJ
MLVSVPSPANHGKATGGSDFDYAAVDEVKMRTRIVNVPVSREECWEQPVTHYQPPAYGGAPSYTPIILGGIIGAVVGNQFGSGSGQDWATVAGTTLGASIGNDYSNRRYAAARSYTTTEQRCRVVNDYQQEERADGYLVTYTYNGRQYETQTSHHPGDRIKVRVDVSPAE